jgi:hypothetical protein
MMGSKTLKVLSSMENIWISKGFIEIIASSASELLAECKKKKAR